MRQNAWKIGLMLLVIVGVLALVTVLVAQDTEPVTFRSSPPDSSLVTLTTVASGFNRPLLVTHAGDDSNRLFVVEQGGPIWIIKDGARLETPFLDVTNLLTWDVNAGGYTERGLLGLAFHPNYAENGQFFINYTDQDGATVVARYRVSADNPDVADANSAEILFTQAQPYANHNGGDIAFGPDGYLYISLGDGGSANDPLGAGQNPFNLLGTILRIDVDGEAPYGIPEDNPFVGTGAGAGEIWAYGLRNVWRFGFDRATGDLYLADVGQNAWEEVNFQPADSPGGENYGWNAYEASHLLFGGADENAVVMPFAEYNHSEGCSITGGTVYRGEAIPDLVGAYLFGDWCSGTVWASYRDEAGTWFTNAYLETGFNISAFGEDEAGEMYIVDHGGQVLRIDPVE